MPRNSKPRPGRARQVTVKTRSAGRKRRSVPADTPVTQPPEKASRPFDDVLAGPVAHRAPPEPYTVGNQPPTPTIMPPKTQTPSNLPQGNQGPPLRVPAVPTPRRRDPPPLTVDLKSALAQQSGGSPLPPPPPHKSSGSPSPQSGSLPSPQQPDGPPPFQQSSGLPPQQSGGPPPSKIATSDDQPAKSTHGHLDSDSRGNLFNDIVRIGQGNLKRVETPDEKPASKTDSDSIIDLLIKEMEKRDRFIHGLDDYDDYEASEWEC